VAALAFGQPVGAVDTNVRRVLGRIVGGLKPPSARELQAVADAAVPLDRPGDWTHALMDVGATRCKPVRPDCPACPAAAWCAFARTGAAPERRVSKASPSPSRSPAFRATSRWLRGRLLDRLREEGDGWIALGAPLGEHDVAAVERALAAMERDGLVERHPSDPGLARLPLG
jgi:adenine-specific DNA glycosylase